MTSANSLLFENATYDNIITIPTLNHTPAAALKAFVLENVSGSLTSEFPSPNGSNDNECNIPTEQLYPSHFGVQLAVPEWEAILTAIVLSVIIVLTIIGNILVILSVFTYKPLRIVQNFFIVSLAVADLTVALLVMPFNVSYSILGRWEFGIHLCKMWLTSDVLCCTSSILNLCAIALDRYWAITDPINYAQKRTVGRVLLLIAGVWVLSLVISSPPLVGWNDWPDEFTSTTPCELTSNRGYVIYSSLGSFFIPLGIMTIVYIEIYIATRRRLRQRAQATKINTLASKINETENETIVETEKTPNSLKSVMCASFCCGRIFTHSSAQIIQNDQESFSSEIQIKTEPADQQQMEHRVVIVAHCKKSRRAKIKDSIKRSKMRGKDRADSQENESKQVKAKSDVSETPLLLPQSVIKKDDVSNNEISTESENDQKKSQQQNIEGDEIGYTTKEEECVSLKITPPQSSIGASSSVSAPFNKKTSGVYQFIEEKQKISLSKERRAARTLGIIMGVFVICWLPFFLMYVILPFCDTCCPTNKLKNFITWLGYINSGLNPVIYTIFNLDYRRAFKRLLGIN